MEGIETPYLSTAFETVQLKRIDSDSGQSRVCEGNMTNEDALAVICVSLDALAHRRVCLRGKATCDLPFGLLIQALDHLELNGADTERVRGFFAECGVDLSQVARPIDSSKKAIDAQEPVSEHRHPGTWNARCLRCSS